MGNIFLKFHQFTQSSILNFLRNNIFEILFGKCTFFLAIGKCAHSLKSSTLYKLLELFKFSFAFTWESYHKCCTNVNTRHFLTNALYKSKCFFFIYMTTHIV